MRIFDVDKCKTFLERANIAKCFPTDSFTSDRRRMICKYNGGRDNGRKTSAGWVTAKPACRGVYPNVVSFIEKGLDARGLVQVFTTSEP